MTTTTTYHMVLPPIMIKHLITELGSRPDPAWHKLAREIRLQRLNNTDRNITLRMTLEDLRDVYGTLLDCAIDLQDGKLTEEQLGFSLTSVRYVIDVYDYLVPES